MDQSESCGMNLRSAQRRRLNPKNDQVENASAQKVVAANDATAQRRLQTDAGADICKLDIDCFEETFDYLEYEDLMNIGRTCKYLNNVAGYCFQQNYYDIAEFQSNEVKYFPQFISNVILYHATDFQQFARVQKKFHRLKKINLCDVQLIKPKIQRINGVLSTLEYFGMERGRMNTNLFGILLNSCPKIKKLRLKRVDGFTNWPLVKCPSLEVLQVKEYGDPFKQVVEFIELNPSIQRLDMNQPALKLELFKNTEIKLNELVLQIYAHHYSYQSLFGTLIELHSLGHFKRLFLDCFVYVFTQVINQLTLLSPMLVGLTVGFNPKYNDAVNFTMLSNVEELGIRNLDDFDNRYIEDAAINLTKLKRVQFLLVKSLDHLLPFIRQAENVSEISMGEFYNNDGIIDLHELNKERQKLANGRDLKVTIFVPDSSYIDTKWARKRGCFDTH